ncbi:MAG: hypothetical protein ABI321_16280 [Polyangia bacterium]
MTAILLVAACAVVVALGMWSFRQAYFAERPMRLWGTDFPDAAAVAEVLAGRTDLRAQQAPEGTDWLGHFFLAPAWVFWGDLRSGRAETRLSRWSLVGSLDVHEVRVQLGPDQVRASAKLSKASQLWARAAAPLEQQEGLRWFHPVGSTRWVEAVARLQSLFAAGAEEVRVEAGELVATVPLVVLTPQKLAVLLFALEALTTHLERD